MGFKRLYFDIENSYMIVKGVWHLGEQRILPENVISYGRIICISYKWQGSDKIHRFLWNKGCDKELMKKFYNVIEQADEVVTHNGDNHDIKWIKTRFLVSGYKSIPDLKSIDTLKIARKFKFPSNKLTEIARYLEKEAGFKIGTKLDHSGLSMWDDVILRNNKKQLLHMGRYCDQDVFLLERIFLFLEGFAKPKTHLGVFSGGDKADCPYCAGTHLYLKDRTVGVSGNIKCRMQCNGCNKSYTIPLKVYNDWNIKRMK